MTKAEADHECAERNRDPAGAPGVRWLAREASPGEWSVVRVTIPGLKATGPLKTSTQARPRPEEPLDPRPLVNPNWGTGF
ncbi:MAG TPA: hypothetical protein VFR49_07390 [Solirubrobacteraceae bacterium]|nr:hypothetical protein [Solirubrobacteraceae bacterium]